MLIKNLKDCVEIIAGDFTILRELFHPDKANVTIRYSLAHAVVKPGQTSQPHILKTSEVYFILEGQGIMFIENEREVVDANQAIYIPPNAMQYIKNTGRSDLRFLCIVDPAWCPEDEIVMMNR